jgi:predicted ATPase
MLNDRSGELVQIGTTKDARYQYSKKKENFSIKLQFKGKEPYQMDFDYTIESDVFKQTNLETNLYGETKSNLDTSESIFSTNFQYLKADRIEPKSVHKKNYTSVVTNKNLGSYGQYTVHFIETYYNDDLEFENLIHKDSITKDEVLGTQIINKTFINQINLWMGEISPGVNIRTTNINQDEVLLEYVFKQPNFGDTNRFKPENVGFGISYALHIVTALLSARTGELIIIENPESHIHPRGQAELGKLIALVAQNDVQIIIETHSDHILNGIRVGVKDNPIMKDRTILFYFKKIVTESEQYSSVTNISIDKNGELSEYPVNLLDEWSNQLFKLM